MQFVKHKADRTVQGPRTRQRRESHMAHPGHRRRRTTCSSPTLSEHESVAKVGRLLPAFAARGQSAAISMAQAKDCVEAVAVLSASGIPASTLYDVRLSPEHPQMIARGYFERLDHPVVGEHQVPTIPFRFRSVDRWGRSPAPTVGEHNESILKDLLGLDDTATEKLVAEKVIGTRLNGIG